MTVESEPAADTAPPMTEVGAPVKRAAAEGRVMTAQIRPPRNPRPGEKEKAEEEERRAADHNAKILAMGDMPPERWVFQPPVRDRLALTIIATFERHYGDTGNPAFVWAARRVAREMLPHLAGDPLLRWIESYLDEITSRLAALMDAPPKTDVNDHIAAALGFDAKPGRGQGSPFSTAQREIRNGRLAAEVLKRLPFENYKQELAIAYVADTNNLSKQTVGSAYRSFKSKIN
jgi:hypothetical protein